jgi:hypothetical protein
LTIETCNTGGLHATTPYFPRTKQFISDKPNTRTATSTEAGPSNPSRNQLVAFGSRQKNQVHEVDDEDDEDDIQEVEARTLPRENNGKRKETHAMENEDDDDEIQEVDPPPPKTTRSRGGSRKPSSTVNGKPTSSSNGAPKGKAKAKPKFGSTKPATKPAHEPMDVDLNDVVEHDDTDMGVNGTAAVANTINTAIKHNAGRAPKSGQQNEDGPIARLEEELRQVRFIGNYRPLLFLLSIQN